ncbi:MAG: hypothetical protein LBU05_00235 [Bifidobacteriaceae bacterium]|jgi:hypothetical protein|nr:hypothetical protein [Bifidobacteriaceae bacterium]
MLVFDAGAFIAAERADRAMWTRIKAALERGSTPVTSTAVIAQVWRGDPRRALLARLIKSTEAVPLDTSAALAAGALLAQTNTADVADAALILTAADGDRIYTSDPQDIARLAQARGLSVEIIPV